MSHGTYRINLMKISMIFWSVGHYNSDIEFLPSHALIALVGHISYIWSSLFTFLKLFTLLQACSIVPSFCHLLEMTRFVPGDRVFHLEIPDKPLDDSSGSSSSIFLDISPCISCDISPSISSSISWDISISHRISHLVFPGISHRVFHWVFPGYFIEYFIGYFLGYLNGFPIWFLRLLQPFWLQMTTAEIKFASRISYPRVIRTILPSVTTWCHWFRPAVGVASVCKTSESILCSKLRATGHQADRRTFIHCGPLIRNPDPLYSWGRSTSLLAEDATRGPESKG